MNVATGRVQTVLGTIHPEQVGVATTHEHVLIDMLRQRRPPVLSDEPLASERVALENLWWVRQNYTLNRDNNLLDDEQLAVAELRRFAAVGGSTVIDATPGDLGRDPMALARISQSSGIHIIMGTGHYVATHHPLALAGTSEELIAERMIRDVVEGVDDTGLRSGIIGEIGCSWPLKDDEQRVLRAAASAQR